MFRWLGKRSTGEIMVIVITFTVCWGVIASGMGILLLSIFRPEIDVTVWVSRVTGLLNTMIGLLAGFLAGRTDTRTPPPSELPKEEP
jgi:ABC-type amino acid transport system permease subunit